MDPVAGTLARPPDQRRADDARERRRRLTRWTTVLPVLAVLLGTALRVRQWAAGRSFWSDELFIVEQLMARSFSVLATEPLARRQSAPVGWLWSERLAFELFGDSELGLRLPSLLAGIATLVLVWRLAQRLLPAAVVAVPVLLTALSPALIRYSNEVKQYPFDVALVLAVLLAALSVPRDRTRPAALLLVAGLGAVSVWASVASAFALAAVSAVLVVDALLRRGVGAALLSGLLLSPWLVSLGVAYVTVLQRSRDNDVLYAYWGPTFPAEGSSLLVWLQSRSAALLDAPLGLADHSTLAKVLLVLGALGLLLRAPQGGSALLGTIALGTVAAGLSLYPLADRLALWLVPLVFVVLAALLPGRLRDSTPARSGLRTAWLLAAAVPLVLVAWQSSWQGLRTVGERQEVEEMRDLLLAVDRARQPGDRVISASSGTTGLVHYGPRTGVLPDGLMMPEARPASGRCEDSAALREAGFTSTRVWVVVRVGSTEGLPNGPLQSIEPRIETVAAPTDRLDEPGVYAVLYEPRPETVEPPEPPRYCVRLDPLNVPS